MRYHGYFFSSACFALIYDLMHGENLAPTHLPWIHATLHCLSSMRSGEPIQSIIVSIQTILKKINPSYEWISPETKNQNSRLEQGMDPMANRPSPIPEFFAGEYFSGGQPPMPPDFQSSSLQDDIHPASVNVGSNEEMFDFTRSDMGWDFDFSTMDLEAFFSTLDQPMS